MLLYAYTWRKCLDERLLLWTAVCQSLIVWGRCLLLGSARRYDAYPIFLASELVWGTSYQPHTWSHTLHRESKLLFYALQSPADLKQPEKQTVNNHLLSDSLLLLKGSLCLWVLVVSKSWCVKLIDPVADEHMYVRRRQFPGIYMLPASRGLVEMRWVWFKNHSRPEGHKQKYKTQNVPIVARTLMHCSYTEDFFYRATNIINNCSNALKISSDIHVSSEWHSRSSSCHLQRFSADLCIQSTDQWWTLLWTGVS